MLPSCGRASEISGKRRTVRETGCEALFVRRRCDLSCVLPSGSPEVGQAPEMYTLSEIVGRRQSRIGTALHALGGRLDQFRPFGEHPPSVFDIALRQSTIRSSRRD